MISTGPFVKRLDEEGLSGYDTFFRDKDSDRLRLSNVNGYWARILVSSIIVEKMKRTRGKKREHLRKIGMWLLPRESRCYNYHLLPKNTSPWECRRCNPE